MVNARMQVRFEKGFQLIEMLIVCLLIAVLAGAAAGSTWEHLEFYRLDNACRLFSSRLSEIRAVSIGLNLPISVEIPESRDRFGFAERGDSPTVWILLPQGVVFRKIPRRTVTFYPRGNAAPAGSFLLENPKGGRKITVAVSGRIRWEVE